MALTSLLYEENGVQIYLNTFSTVFHGNRYFRSYFCFQDSWNQENLKEKPAETFSQAFFRRPFLTATFYKVIIGQFFFFFG